MRGQRSNSDLTGLTTCDHQQTSQAWENGIIDLVFFLGGGMGEVYDSEKIQRDGVKLGSNFTLPEKSLNFTFMIAFMLTDEYMCDS